MDNPYDNLKEDKYYDLWQTFSWNDPPTSDSDDERCEALTKKGTRCKLRKRGRLFCKRHDTEKINEALTKEFCTVMSAALKALKPELEKN